MSTFCHKCTHSKKMQTHSPRDTLAVDALLFGAFSLIHWWYAPLTTTLSNILRAEWLYWLRRLECVSINLFVFSRFHSVCFLNPLLKLKFVYFSPHVLIICSIYFSIHHIQCLCSDIIVPTQTEQSFSMFLCPWIDCSAVCVCCCWGAYVSGRLLCFWFMCARAWMCVCACMCVNDMALNTSPRGTSLLHTSMHHNASAIYEIDDRRLCRSGQNDAADIHRGTLTDNGKQREAGGHHGQTERKKNWEKCSRRWTDG